MNFIFLHYFFAMFTTIQPNRATELLQKGGSKHKNVCFGTLNSRINSLERFMWFVSSSMLLHVIHFFQTVKPGVKPGVKHGMNHGMNHGAKHGPIQPLHNPLR